MAELKKISTKELKEILDKHKKWLHNEEGGERADLCDYDLGYNDLRQCNLIGSSLRNCILRGADLSYSNLREADLVGCDLSGADLSCSNLSICNISKCDLSSSDLSYCDLIDCDIIRCDLRGCYLKGADLTRCDLNGSDLRGCDIDCSFFPLFAGTLGIKVDKDIAQQMAYHFCKLDCNDPDFIKARDAIADFANGYNKHGVPAK